MILSSVIPARSTGLNLGRMVDVIVQLGIHLMLVILIVCSVMIPYA